MDTVFPEHVTTSTDDSAMEVDSKEIVFKYDAPPLVEHVDIHCYCGKVRNYATTELQCGNCMKYFHKECIKKCVLGNIASFMTNYQFICKNCNQTGIESFTKKQASFSQMCHTALANLIRDNPTRSFFSKDQEIIVYLEKNWESLTTMPRRTKPTWPATIAKTMLKDSEIFLCDDENAEQSLFTLVSRDIGKIGPNYEGFFKLTSNALKDYKIGPYSTDGKSGRTAKRKMPSETAGIANTRQRRGEAIVSSVKIDSYGFPMEHPYNKDGYRYILAESDPHAPGRQAFDEGSEWAGRPIPGCLYRPFMFSDVLLSLHDRAPQLKVSDERRSVTGEKGYSMIRATHGVDEGAWYFEAEIVDMPPDSAVRLGWSQPLGNLQAPCGYDRFSYSWRSKKGTKFHMSKGKHYSEGYGEGDILGFYISLPAENSASLLPPSHKEKPLIKFKNHFYFEEKDDVPVAIKKLKACLQSEIAFFKNGLCQGVAFEDIFQGIYFPCISLYKNATVKVNFGPKFKYAPKTYENVQPISKVGESKLIGTILADIIDHVANENKVTDYL